MTITERRFGYEQRKLEEKKIVKELLKKFDNHRKSNDLWRLPEEHSWSLAEEWIEEAFNC